MILRLQGLGVLLLSNLPVAMNLSTGFTGTCEGGMTCLSAFGSKYDPRFHFGFVFRHGAVPPAMAMHKTKTTVIKFKIESNFGMARLRNPKLGISSPRLTSDGQGALL